MPTDTIYGLVGNALNEKTVERIYKLRKRNPDKPMVILISDVNDLNKFGVKLSTSENRILKHIWPNKVSIVLSCKDKRFEYLHRRGETLAFRMPKDQEIIEVLNKVGPLVAPSANIEGQPPAESIIQAKKYFGEEVDFYIDGGVITSQPSTLVKLEGGQLKVLRQGEIKIGL